MPPSDFQAPEVGTEAFGFRVTGAPAAVRIEAWGYWPPDVASAFARQVTPITRKFSPDAVFAFDANELKPQGIEGQEALRAFFVGLSTTAFAKGTLLARNVLTRMQLTRLLRECGLDQRIGFGD